MKIETFREVSDKSYPSMREFVEDNLLSLWEYFRRNITETNIHNWALQQDEATLSRALGRPVKFEE
jgi:hypothetical protein